MPYAILAGNAGNLGGQPPASYAPVTGLSNYVARVGDTMTGSLNLIAPATLGFGAQTRQMIDLWNNNGADYGIGVQASTFYQRAGAPAGGFAWYNGGVHSNAQNDPGTNGTTLMTLGASGILNVPGAITAGPVSGTNTFGDGVYGSGKNGVHGESGSVTDSGVWGNNSVGGVGVSGSSPTGTGVSGSSSSGDGVHGHGKTGVRGDCSGSGGAGVSGNNIFGDGVYGFGVNGVHGESYTGSDSGVWGNNSYGGIGVSGSSSYGDGVYGWSNKGDSSHAGVYGENAAIGGTGMLGKALNINSAGVAGVADTAGSTGVYGRGTKWGGYFEGPVSVCSLQIRGGCDLAEPFAMASPALPKGSVVVIDEQHTGMVRLSDQPYDTRVAGVISGANGINPGLSLHQAGVIEGGQDVALTGRVYVLADATSSPIIPGDLLTTSGTPGHAMKASHSGKAQGAILGKAMSPLRQGKGMVLVLVTLQ